LKIEKNRKYSRILYILLFCFICFDNFLFSQFIDSKIITLNNYPKNLQLYPRELNDSAIVRINGNYLPSFDDTLTITVKKENYLIDEKIFYINKNQKYFEYNINIHSEESNYFFTIESKIFNKTIFKADSIVCGDVFVIMGQSNSHPTNDSATIYNSFFRSFGRLTENGNYDYYNVGDTLWGISNAHGFGCRFCGYYMVGVWGLKLQKLIFDKYKIPTCIINVGTGGSKIEENLKNEKNPIDLNTIYGKLLYRTIKSNTKNSIKAIFWFQGEANCDDSYKNYDFCFEKLYQAWKKDFPNLKRIYLFQIRPGCDGEHQTELRNIQRNIARKYNEVELISTTGVEYHVGCHYYLNGYYQLAEQTFKFVEKDFYNNLINIKTPDVISIKYLNKELTKIEIVFDQKIKLLSKEELFKIKDYFYTLPFLQYPINITQEDIRIVLEYKSSNYSTKLVYLPNKYYNNSNYVYEGPFLKNYDNIGLASFIENIRLFNKDSLITDNNFMVIYPSISSEFFIIRLNIKNKSSPIISIYDVTGKKIKEYKYYDLDNGVYEFQVSIKEFSTGMYYITAKNNSITSVKKMLFIK